METQGDQLQSGFTVQNTYGTNNVFMPFKEISLL